MRKFTFLILLLSFSLEVYAKQPNPTPLPSFPERKEAILLQKEKTEKQKDINPIIWNLDWHTGIQQITIKQVNPIDDVNMDMSEIILPSNKYKGANISLDIGSLFSIYSNLFIGFTKENFPKNFSINTIPYQYPHLSSIESDSYIAKKFFLKTSLTVAPYAGYSFSRYSLLPLQEGIEISNKIYHSIVLGSKFIFRPHRIFFFETGISISPITAIDRNLLSMFQINYEGCFTLTTNLFSFSLLIANRDNIEYKNVHQEANTVSVSKIGFRFKVLL
ncbi:MAG: hypothetical protein U0I22_05250 [Treponema sp.]|nr:hypothetical protein [Treponema sp.]